MRVCTAVCLSMVLCAPVVTAGAVGTASQQNAGLEAQAQDLVSEYVGRLQPTLKQALAEGGPTLAIEVCASEAPKIAQALSAESGWLVKRVSLKSRNASRAQPDSWERPVLEEFDRRQAAGELPADIHQQGQSNGQFRYMQAQGVVGVCLLCHGENLSQPVQDALQQYYPDDRATGYLPGQIRGAISLSKRLE